MSGPDDLGIICFNILQRHDDIILTVTVHHYMSAVLSKSSSVILHLEFLMIVLIYLIDKNTFYITQNTVLVTYNVVICSIENYRLLYRLLALIAVEIKQYTKYANDQTPWLGHSEKLRIKRTNHLAFHWSTFSTKLTTLLQADQIQIGKHLELLSF